MVLNATEISTNWLSFCTEKGSLSRSILWAIKLCYKVLKAVRIFVHHLNDDSFV